MAGPRRSLKMSEENWQVIDDIAEDLNATAKTGSRVGLPSWRSMLYQIATGKLSVVETARLHGHITLVTDVVDGVVAEIIDIAKAINRLEVKPRSSGTKRHILARLREIYREE